MARRGLARRVAVLTDPSEPRDGAARGRVRFAEIAPGERVAIRHYFRGGLFGRLVRDLFLDPGRGFRELALYDRARAAGVPTLEPVGAVARRAGLLFWRLDLVTRAVAGAADLAARAGDRRAIEAAARAVRALHDAGIEHADLNLRNILIGPDGRAIVIDLDRARARGGPLGPRARLRNLFRLYRSGVKVLGRVPPRAAVRFGRAYFRKDRAALRQAARALDGYRARIAVRSVLWRRSPPA